MTPNCSNTKKKKNNKLIEENLSSNSYDRDAIVLLVYIHEEQDINFGALAAGTSA